MIAHINPADPLDPGLASHRNSAAVSAPAQAGSSASNAVNNALVDRLFDRVKGLSHSAPNEAEDIGDQQSAAQDTENARASMLERPATAMAAQANQLPQTVLELLQ